MLRDHSKPKSAIALLIEQATNGSAQQEENWSLFMHICDFINRSHDEGAKEAAKAIRKRFGCKVQENIVLTLKLLETCMKNCGRSFHYYVATPKFMQEMIKTINPKYHPPIGMQNLVLGLIQAWAHAFRTVPELREFNKAYQDLKLKGVEFPPLDPELAPVSKQPPAKVPVVSSAIHGDAGSKLMAELGIVRNNCKVFGDMLTELKPGQGTASDLELLEDLNSTCRQMQKRITELIETSQFEKHTEQLLLVNDELNNVFIRYDRFKRQQSQMSSAHEPFQLEPNTSPQQESIYDEASPWTETAASATSASSKNVNPPIYDTLIDFGSDTQPVGSGFTGYPTSAMQELSIYDNDATVASSGFPQNFDPFVVQSQPPWQQSNQVLAPANLETSGTPETLIDKDSDFEEMAKWLKENPRASTAEVDEFELFLNARARDMQQQPSVQPSHADQNKSTDANQSELLLL